MTDFAAVRAVRAARKAKRAEKAKTLWPPKPCGDCGAPPGMCSPVHYLMVKPKKAGKAKRKKSPSLSKLKAELWKLISLVVRSWSEVCVACRVNPTYSANHIVPANDGAATRFFLPNLYPGCASCNESERRQRGSWVYRHREMFGADFVDALYAFSETTHQVKKWWVLEQTERMRKLLGAA